MKNPLVELNEARKRFAVRRYRWRHRYLHRYDFVHINKTAGSSIKYALGIPWENKHKTALEKIEELGEACWERKFTFAVVRNPWDRLVSQYHYRIDSAQNNLHVNTIPFVEWVKKTFHENDPVYYDDPQMFQPQLDWITDEKGNLLVDFVCRYERLNQDFSYVCKKIGRNEVLPHRKASKRGPYQEYFDEEAKAIVEKWFQKDIAQFHYSY